MNTYDELIASGNLEGFSSKPICITTVISRVYIFENENVVLKIYKRDNEWWNKDMNDLSQGESRIRFITNDFKFNQTLNPEVYLSLKTIKNNDGMLTLEDPTPTDDELVIVMKKVDISQTMTKVLFEKRLPAEAFESIGKNFATKKLSLSKEFLPDLNTNWYEQMVSRFNDLASWVRGAEQFPTDLKEIGLTKLNAILEQQKEKFSQINRDSLFPLIDCNSENLVVLDGVVSYIDAYPPKESWRIGSLDVDVFRAGSDIYALAGKDEFDAFMKGVYSEADHLLDKDMHDFYLLYGAMVMGPYFYMLSEKEPAFLEKAKKYDQFIESLIQ